MRKTAAVLGVAGLCGPLAICRNGCDAFFIRCDTLVLHDETLDLTFCHGIHGLCTLGCWSSLSGDSSEFTAHVETAVGLDLLWSSLGLSAPTPEGAMCFGECNAQWAACERLKTVSVEKWSQLQLTPVCQLQQHSCFQDCPRPDWRPIRKAFRSLPAATVAKMVHLARAETVLGAADVADVVATLADPPSRKRLMATLEAKVNGLLAEGGGLDIRQVARSWHGLAASERDAVISLEKDELRARRATH